LGFTQRVNKMVNRKHWSWFISSPIIFLV
jgi:hypothetical protein